MASSTPSLSSYLSSPAFKVQTATKKASSPTTSSQKSAVSYTPTSSPSWNTNPTIPPDVGPGWNTRAPASNSLSLGNLRAYQPFPSTGLWTSTPPARPSSFSQVPGGGPPQSFGSAPQLGTPWSWSAGAPQLGPPQSWAAGAPKGGAAPAIPGGSGGVTPQTFGGKPQQPKNSPGGPGAAPPAYGGGAPAGSPPSVTHGGFTPPPLTAPSPMGGGGDGGMQQSPLANLAYLMTGLMGPSQSQSMSFTMPEQGQRLPFQLDKRFGGDGPYLSRSQPGDILGQLAGGWRG